MLWKALRITWWNRTKNELRVFIMRQKRSGSKKRRYSEKVRQGICPYKYPFATGAAAMAQRDRNAVKYSSPPTDVGTSEYTSKPRNRRVG